MNPKIEKILNILKALPPKIWEFIRTFPQKHKQAFVFLIIIFSAIAIVTTWIKLQPPQKKVEPVKLAPLVKVATLEKQDLQMIVTGYGTARAKVEVEIVPQVSGKIVSVNPQFKAGGFIKAGQEILKIDPRDYELLVRQAKAGVADAQVKLEMEQAEAEIAIEEWRQLHPGTEPNSPLVLRKPQIKQAHALLESAGASLATAKLNLERTSISLPIDVRIVSETIDLGQFVATGQPVGKAYGIEAIEIEVPLEDKELAWFDIPDAANGNKQGSDVIVKADFAGKEHSWQGYVKRTVGQIDTKSRLVYVVIEVPEPFKTKTALLPGLFVEIQIQGKMLKDAFAVSRDTVHNTNEIWLFNDNKLHTKKLDIIRTDKNFIYTGSKLNDGDQLITSPLDAVVDGMSIRIKQAEETEIENL